MQKGSEQDYREVSMAVIDKCKKEGTVIINSKNLTVCFAGFAMKSTQCSGAIQMTTHKVAKILSFTGAANSMHHK